MSSEEFSDQFDVLYNNITSNQAPGCTEYEKSVFLTKAQNEIVKNYFTANSKGNNIGQGFDDSAKRQADFSCLMMTRECDKASSTAFVSKIDFRTDTLTYEFPDDVFIVINESIVLSKPAGRMLQVIPLRYDEYMRLMSKPFKRPLKYQAWRLINNGAYNGSVTDRYAELIIGPNQTAGTYHIRYIRFPKPIIVGDLDGLTIDGYEFGDSGSGGGGDDPTPTPTPTPSSATLDLSQYSGYEGQKITIQNDQKNNVGFSVFLLGDGESGEPLTITDGGSRGVQIMCNVPYGTTLSDFKSTYLDSSDGLSNYISIMDWPSGDTVTDRNSLAVALDGSALSLDISGDTPNTRSLRDTSTSVTSETAKYTQGCELDPVIHQDILQRAVELAKVSWTATGQDNAQMVLQAGQRSE